MTRPLRFGIASARLGLATAFAVLTRALRDIRGASTIGIAGDDALIELSRSIDVQHHLRRIESLGFAGKFCSAVAHEISTPLNVVTGRIALALRKLPPDSPARDDLAVMLAQTERVADIVRTALQPLRLPPPVLAPVELSELLARILPALEPLADARSVDLAVSVSTDAPRVRADAEQLTQVMLDLLVNALETTPSGGRVTLAARRWPARQRALLRISISDSGPGLPAGVVARVFDPLFLAKTAADGVSLALGTARDILRAHHGELRVDSEGGAGSTWTLELPAIEEEDCR
ncbi:MAG TPA: ATP-binding protein [Methylomirabilota bacterium]|nr:ATP-binding protein [Methylomirabilota bacterium]